MAAVPTCAASTAQTSPGVAYLLLEQPQGRHADALDPPKSVDQHRSVCRGIRGLYLDVAVPDGRGVVAGHAGDALVQRGGEARVLEQPELVSYRGRIGRERDGIVRGRRVDGAEQGKPQIVVPAGYPCLALVAVTQDEVSNRRASQCSGGRQYLPAVVDDGACPHSLVRQQPDHRLAGEVNDFSSRRRCRGGRRCGRCGSVGCRRRWCRGEGCGRE